MAIASTTRRAESEVDQERRDRRVGPGQGDDRERGGRQRGEDRQRRLRDDVGQAGRPQVERDGPEAHRDRHREGEVGEPEHDRLGGELAQVPPEPGGRGDGQRARDDDRAGLPDADGRAGAAVARDERHEDPEQPAGGRDQDGGARVDEAEGQPAGGRGWPGSPPARPAATRRPARRPRGPARRASRGRGTAAGRRSSPGRHRSISTTCAGSMASAANDRHDEPDDARRPSGVPGRCRRIAASPPKAIAATTNTIRLIAARPAWASTAWLDRLGVDSLSSNPSPPSDRAAKPRIATAPPRVATRPAVRSCSSGSGVPPRLVRMRSAPLEQQHQADPDPQDVAPGHDRQDREGRQGEPGRRRQVGSRRRHAEPVRAVPDDRRAHREERVRRPADERAAGPDAVPAGRDPQHVPGQHRGDETGREGQRLGQRIGQDRDPDHGDDQPEDRGPRVPGGPGHDGPDDDRERDPHEGRVHGSRLMERRLPAPGRSASGGSRRCRAASSAARRGR